MMTKDEVKEVIEKTLAEFQAKYDAGSTSNYHSNINGYKGEAIRDFAKRLLEKL